MGLQGYLLLVAVIFFLAFVMPKMAKRRFVASEVRIDERYSTNLRMLTLSERTEVLGAKGASGAIFAKKPEVIVASNLGERPGPGRPSVRVLARQRARHKARISQRAANRQRGFVGAGILLTLTLIFGILGFNANFTKVPFWIFLFCTVGYGVSFGYLLAKMGEATRKDRQAIEDLTEDMEHVRGAEKPYSRRPTRPSSGVSAKSARSGLSAPSAFSAHVSVSDTESIETAQTAATVSDDGSTFPENGDFSGKAQTRLDREHSGRDFSRSDNARSTGIPLAIEEGFVASSDFAPISGSRREAGMNDGAVLVSKTRTVPMRRASQVQGDLLRGASLEVQGRAQRQIESGAQPGAVRSPSVSSTTAQARSAVPSSPTVRTVTPRNIAPYEPPAQIEAPVPYRPKTVGEKVAFSDEFVSQDSASRQGVEVRDDAVVQERGYVGLAGGVALDKLMKQRRA